MYEENIEEEADVKDILTSDEKSALTAKKNNYDSKLEILIKEYGQQDRINIDKLDTGIEATIENMDSTIGNIMQEINIKMAALEFLQHSKGYENMLDNAPQLKDGINILKTVVKGMIQQTQFLNIIIEYLKAEKSVAVEKLKTTKNSSEFINIISERERIQKEGFNTLKEFYQESLNSLKEDIRLLRARLYGVSDSEKREEEKIEKEKAEAEKKRKSEEQKKTDLEDKKSEKPDLHEEIG